MADGFAPAGSNQSGALTGLKITNAAASGVTALVAAVSGKKTMVHRLKLSVAGATIVQIRDGATVLDTFNLAANQSVVLEFSSLPWYVTSTNSALNINSSAAVQVDGRVEYITA